MSGFRTVTVTRSYCSQCGKELRDARDWSLCRRQHMLEHYASTPEGRNTLDMLRAMGFKDEPDSPPLRREREER